MRVLLLYYLEILLVCLVFMCDFCNWMLSVSVNCAKLRIVKVNALSVTSEEERRSNNEHIKLKAVSCKERNIEH